MKFRKLVDNVYDEYQTPPLRVSQIFNIVCTYLNRYTVLNFLFFNEVISHTINYSLYRKLDRI